MNLHRSILVLGLSLAATSAFAATAPATPATPAKPATTVHAAATVKHTGKCEQRSKLGHCLKWSDSKAAPAAAAKT